MTKRRILAVLVAAPFAVAALTGATGQVPGFDGLGGLLGRGTSALALPDSATVVAGKSVIVDVLDNDTYRGSRKFVTLRVTSTPTGLTAKVSKQRLTVTAKPTTKAGAYTLKYRLTDTGGSKSNAKVRIRVTAATTTPTPTATTTPTPTPTPTPTSTATPTPAAGTLLDRINALPVATENRTGYDRTLFKHWNSGLPTGSGGIAYCDTRDEVLIAESVIKATWSGSSCTLTGEWYSYYDGVTITNPSDVDLDHMVPLAEAWDSGASAWTAAKREAYANDQGDPRSLVGVTFSANRGKGDQDPAEWMPLKERCRYLGEWVAAKSRWGLTADRAEIDSMLYSANACENVTIEVIPYTG